MSVQRVFSGFDILLERMGAKKVAWRPGGEREDIDVNELLKGPGIEVDIDEIDFDNNGLPTYAGEVVLLYIKDTKKDIDTLLNNPDQAVRFHVSDCTVLERMRTENRFERYVATRNSSGLFAVNSYDWKSGNCKEVKSRLRVCKKCLEKINFQGYVRLSAKQRQQIWKDFNIFDFLSAHRPLFRDKPRHTDETAPPPGYTNDWEAISHSRRAAAGWTCEACGVDLSTRKDLLHVHHRNGVTGDNSAGNLQVLCLDCHSKQPGHRMHVSSEAYIRIDALRRDQRR